MNPYDDEPTYRGDARSSRHARADDYPGGRDPYEGYAEPTTRAVTGRASVGRASAEPDGYPYAEPTTTVGRASVGRASVSGAAPVRATSPEEPVYGAPYGDAAYGGAAYGGAAHGGEPVYGAPYGEAAYGSSPYASEPVSPSRGSAPVSPSRGSAPVSPSGAGRAQVRPMSPSTPPAAGGAGRGPNGPLGPGGRPPVPGAPGGEGPGDRGPGDPGRRRPFGGFGLGGERRRRGPNGAGPAARAKLSRKARIRNIVIAAVALLVVLSGGGFVAGTLYVDQIEPADALQLPETTTLYYSDGTELAKLGENTRFVVPFDNMSPYVVESMIASEDGTFWTNEGVQFSAIIRAAWNNFTGGEQQGGSTITQQYARLAFNLKGATYNRKIREAVYAWKLSDQMSKQEIIANYLNIVEFGRQTYGAEAAALAFFGKSIRKDAPPEKQITRTEAMALVAMVKQPEIDETDPDGAPGYDPTRGEEGSPMRAKAEENAKGRWDYVKGQLLTLSAASPEQFTLTPDEAATLEFPTTWIPAAQYTSSNLTAPVGLVVNHVLDELTHTPGSYFEGWPWDNIRNGGFQIITTLHPGAQTAAVGAADEYVAGSVMSGQPAHMQAAVVGVQPGTGRVLAYYGGHDGTKVDYAGIYNTEETDPTTGMPVMAGFGGHPPGSSAKAYVVAAALRAGYSLNSYWQWTPHDQAGRAEGNRVRNASNCVSDWDREKREARSGLCSLLESTVASLNVPFYDITISLTAAGVLQMAYDAGIEHIWNDDGLRIDLDTLGGDVTPAVRDLGIGLEVGIGQYKYTVVDHANGMATFASGGLRAEAHFVIEVRKGDQLLFGETLPNPESQRIMNQAQIDNLNHALHQVAPNININGFEAATKTGTWEFQNGGADANAHAWNVGYTNVLAAAAWVGAKETEQALYDANGNPLYGSGLPRQVWEKFMKDATAAMALQGQQRFNEPNFAVGQELPSSLSYPSPTPSPTPTPSRTTQTSGPTTARVAVSNACGFAVEARVDGGGWVSVNDGQERQFNTDSEEFSVGVRTEGGPDNEVEFTVSREPDEDEVTVDLEGDRCPAAPDA